MEINRSHMEPPKGSIHFKTTYFCSEMRSRLLVIGFSFMTFLLVFFLPILLGFDNPKTKLVSSGPTPNAETFTKHHDISWYIMSSLNHPQEYRKHLHLAARTISSECNNMIRIYQNCNEPNLWSSDKRLCAASCFRNSSTLPMSSRFWLPAFPEVWCWQNVRDDAEIAAVLFQMNLGCPQVKPSKKQDYIVQYINIL